MFFRSRSEGRMLKFSLQSQGYDYDVEPGVRPQ